MESTTTRAKQLHPSSDTRLSPAMKTTGVYLLTGLGLLLAGFAVQPRTRTVKIAIEEERVLFPELSDPSKAASLEILRYDDELATIHPFKVVKTGGVWVLPSHQNYPADAKEQLAAAATELVDLQSLDVVSRTAADHETYGVIEPDPEKLEAGMTGIGELIEVRDSAGTKLARLVVGKEDRSSRSGQAPAGKSIRFVRKAGQDPVYRVSIDLSKFPTAFENWIEKDLLKLSPWDIKQVVLDDYALAAVEAGGRLRVEQQRKDRMTFGYVDKDGKWSLEKLESTDANEPSSKAVEKTLGEDEELVTTKLNDLRNAVGDLKIVDVVRKPAGLSADLKAEESFTGDSAAVASLQQRGFLPLNNGEILSTDGETIVGLKDGVEYVLRFGATTTVAKSDGTEKDASSDEAGGRYVLVMARVNEDLLEKPAIEAVPETGSGEGTKPQASPDAPKADGDRAGSEAGSDEAAGKKGPDEKGGTPESQEKDEPAAEEGAHRLDPSGVRVSPFRLVALNALEDESEDGNSSDVKNGDSNLGKQDAKPADKDEGKVEDGSDGKSASKEDSAAKALDAAEAAEARMQAAVEERRRVERENKRKQDEYDDAVKAARKKVRDLNNRFADWYYIVS
ncbi:MAG: DUF4340 domain-containing protein, partial [Planctomycetaceae bacterium]